MNIELYIVAGVSLIAVGGLFFYMLRLEGRVKDLENRE